MVIECVVNVSEGRDQELLRELAAAASPVVLDVHSDRDHHRSVFTLGGPVDDVLPAVKALAAVSVARLDLRAHHGAHPRLGVLDVVPFVPYSPGQPPLADLNPVVPLRDEFAHWLSANLSVPTFLYGPLHDGLTRILPQVRAHAFEAVRPDFGPDHPHESAGATAVGVRPVLVAYNVWVSTASLAQRVAPLVRGPLVRALGLAVGERAQVSCNLIDPGHFGPAQIYDLVTDLVEKEGGQVVGAELVGLLPQAILKDIPAPRWAQLDLSADTTIESRLGG